MTTVIISDNTTGSYIGDYAGSEADWIYDNNSKTAGTSLYISGNAGAEQFSFIRFTGLSNIPSSATVSSVTTGLFRLTSNTPSMDTNLRRMLVPWVAGSNMDWTNYDGSTPLAWNTPGGLGDGTDRSSTDAGIITIGNGNNFYNVSDTGGQLTSDIQGIIDGSYANNGHGYYCSVAAFREISGPSGTDGQRPFMQVVYTVSTGINLSIDNIMSNSLVSNISLSQSQNLSFSAILLQATIDTISVLQQQGFAVSAITSGPVMSDAGLQQQQIIAVPGLQPQPVMGALALSQAGIMTLAQMVSDGLMDAVVVTQANVQFLVVTDAGIDSVISSLAINMDQALTISDAIAGAVLSGVDLAQSHQLDISSLLSSVSLDTLSMNVDSTAYLVPLSVSAQAIMNAVNLQQDQGLMMADMASDATMDSIVVALILLGVITLPGITDMTPEQAINSLTPLRDVRTLH